MATHEAAQQALPVLRDPIIRRRQRVFRLDYICEDCQHEWTDYLLVAGPSYCPCCDRRVEPYLATECEEEILEIPDEEDER